MTSRTGQRHGHRSFPAKTRRAVLRTHKVCQLQFTGCTTKPTEVDHIVGHADALAAGWALEDIDHPSNAQAVCRNCHSVKTGDEIRRGKERAKQRRPRQRKRKPHPGVLR